jgi:soluble lytic murein transglycosylase-like protein
MNRFLIALLLASSNASAYCFDAAGAEFDVNPLLVETVCYTESTMRPKVVNSGNSDGSTDFGLCQINSWWLPRLEKLGITKDDLLNDPCLNTRVSAWIIAQNFETSGEGWLAIGAYNVGYEKTEEKDAARKVYIAKVKENLENLTKWGRGY